MATQPRALQGNESGQSGADLRRAARPTLGQWLQSATVVLIAMNVVVYAVMVARGVSWISPTAESVLGWGADYGPLTLHGQWWRMIVSTFLHFGIIHIAFNMFVLLNIGLFMERLAGRLRFVVLYLVCGLGGSAASLAWHPSTVSAGASGAIFGLYGALLGFLLRHRGSIAPEALASQRKAALAFIAYNVLYGLRPGVDMAAHLGGLAAGFVLGLFLIEWAPAAVSSGVAPASTAIAPAANWRVPLAIAMGLALIVAPALALPKPDDYLAEYRRFGVVEERAINLYDASLKQWNAGKISEEQYADILEKQILPPWRAEREAMEKLKVSRDIAERHGLLVEYFQDREQGWELTAQGLRTHGADKLKQGAEKEGEAEQVVGRLRK